MASIRRYLQGGLRQWQTVVNDPTQWTLFINVTSNFDRTLCDVTLNLPADRVCVQGNNQSRDDKAKSRKKTARRCILRLLEFFVVSMVPVRFVPLPELPKKGAEKRLVFRRRPREHLTHQNRRSNPRRSRTNETLHSTQPGGPGPGESRRSCG